LPKLGLRTALVERELVGRECACWACIPSKTLLRPPEVRFEAQRTAGTAAPEQSWSEVAEYRDYMVSHLDDSNQVEGYERTGSTSTGPRRASPDPAAWRWAEPSSSSFEVRRQFLDGDTVCSIIDWEMALPGVVRMTAAELLDVADGRIVRGELIYDAEELRRAMVRSEA
jgi:hypothetical protein